MKRRCDVCHQPIAGVVILREARSMHRGYTRLCRVCHETRSFVPQPCARCGQTIHGIFTRAEGPGGPRDYHRWCFEVEAQRESAP